MKLIILMASALLAIFSFTGCGDTSSKTLVVENNNSDNSFIETSESNASDNKPKAYSSSGLHKQMTNDSALAIKPIQLIRNQQELYAFYNAMQIELDYMKFDEETIDFTKDLIVSVKRFSNTGFSGNLDSVKIFL